MYILNKGKSDTYKQAMKIFTKNIKEFDVTQIVRLDTLNNCAIDAEVQKFVLMVYAKGNDFSYKEKVKSLKNIYNKFGVENILYKCIYYSSLISNITMPQFVTVADEGNIHYNNYIKNNFYDDMKLLLNLQTTYLMCLIFNNDLLDKEIEYILPNNETFKFIKKLKSDKVCVFQSPYGLYLIPSKKVFESHSKYGHSDDDYINIEHSLGIDFYSTLVAQILFKSDFLKFFSSDSMCLENNNMRVVSTSSFRKRKFLVPHGGVVIKVLNQSSEIESIYLAERKLRELMFIVACVRYKNGQEHNICIPLNSSKVVPIHCRCVNEVLEYVSSFYQLPPDADCSYKKNQFDYEVISPYYWRYRNNNYIPTDDKIKKLTSTSEYIKKYKYISTFVRNITGNPSDKALSLAKEFCIDLEKNQTIVTEHTRSYLEKY